MLKYVLTFLISMVPIVELRGGVPFGIGMGIKWYYALPICMIGNMIPVPFIFFFARRILEWGKDKRSQENSLPGAWKGRKRRSEASGEGRKGSLYSTSALRWDPTPGYRRMDRHSRSKLPQYGFQKECHRSYLRSSACGYHHDSTQSRRSCRFHCCKIN